MNGMDSEKPIQDDRNYLRSTSKLSSRHYEVFDIEIDQGCSSCQIPWQQKGNIQLHHIRDLPNFIVRHNPHIHYGYRVFLPFSLCIKSLFMWHNETVNIWSHLLGFCLFFLLMVYDNLIVIPQLNGSYIDHIVVSVSLLCFQFCLLCSTGFHLFNCHSEKARHRWLRVDMAGICFGLIGCYIPGVHYAFYCFSIWRDIYFLTVFLLGVSVLYVQLHPRISPDKGWHLRVSVFCGLVAYGLIPTFHWIYLNGGWSHSIVKVFAPKVACMYLLESFAFLFYITKCPEKCLPGKVDYLGSSHQLWHIFSLLAFYYWHQAGQEILEYRISNPCF